MPITYLPFSTTEPRPTPPSDYLNVPTNPREFGAGVAQGLQTLGAGTSHAGQVFGEIASDDQANQVLTGLDDINAKFRALQGKDRMDAYPQMRQQQQDLLTKARGNLTTIGQTVDFDRQTRYLASRAQREMGDLYDQSMKEWGIGVNKTGAEHSLNQGSQAVLGGDTDAVANHQQDFINFRIKEAQMRYGTDLAPEIRDNVVANAKRDYTESQIRTLMVTPGRAGEAQTMLENNRSLFSGTPGYDALSNAVKAHAFKGEVDALVSGAISGHMPGRISAGEKGTVTPQQVSEAAVRNGYDPVAANVAASIESNHGGAAVNTVAPSYQGVLQLGPQERASVGGSAEDVGSLADQLDQGTKLLARRKTELASAIGHEPSGFEVWLAHNQGVAGATKLLSNPNAPAGQLVPPINISNNGGNPAAPASQFVGMWQQKYAQREAQFAGQAGVAMQGRQAATDLGAQGGIVPSGEVTPAYRSPGLTAALDTIANSSASEEAKQAASARVEHRFAAQEADQNRYEMALQKQRKETSESAEKEYIAAADPANPGQLTATDAYHDPRLTPDAQLRMIGFMNRSEKPDPLSKISQQTTTQLLEDMRRDPGDPKRIADTAPIYDAFIHSQLNRADFDFLTKQFSDIRSPQGEKLAQQEKEFMAGIKPYITKANPLMGVLDPTGEQNLYMFEWTMHKKIDDARAAGKDPFALFNPASPDYLGKPDALRPYQSTFQESLKAKTGAISAPPVPPAYPGAPAAAPVAAPAVVPRQPGETPGDYLRRIGAAVAPIPPAAAAPTETAPAPPLR